MPQKSVTMKKFRAYVLAYHKKHGRALLWRENTDPYWVVVSEIMLQQTQVPRALIKFPEFIAKFPNFKTLAAATTPEVLSVWQGLGYNRRALYLKRTAEIIVAHHGGVLPRDIEILKRFPGIGPNTAASILAFAYNIPHPFIETNVRTVFLHHFFSDEENISDAQLVPFITEALDRRNTRRWHWALMDYGTYLKKTFGNAGRRSRHYTKQPKFQGSLRQLRGHMVRLLLEHEKITAKKILKLSAGRTQEDVETALGQLVGEGFVTKTGQAYRLTK